MNTIQERIEKLNAEQYELSQTHDKMVAEFQAATRHFQERVQTNQARYQQLTGAIAELQRLFLVQEIKTESPIKNEHRPHPRSHAQHRTVVD